MEKETIQGLIGICNMISTDVENDIKEFEGKEFTGKNVSTLFGYQAAAINALSKIIKEILENNE